MQLVSNIVNGNINMMNGNNGNWGGNNIVSGFGDKMIVS